MSENEKSLSPQKLVRMLNELGEYCEEASMTGNADAGVKRAIRHYNAILGQVKNTNGAGTEMFAPIDEGSSLGDVAVECRMLIGFLKASESEDEDDECCGTRHGAEGFGMVMRLAPFVSRDDLGELVRTHLSQHTKFDPDVLTGLAPFLDRDTLGEMLKKHLKATITISNETRSNAAEPVAPVAPVAPVTPVAPVAPATPDERSATVIVTTRDEPNPDIAEKIAEITLQLGNPALEQDERQMLVNQLVELGRMKAEHID